MFAPWPVPQSNGCNSAPQGDGIWGCSKMEELKVYEGHQHLRALFVMFTQEYTNIECLLHFSKRRLQPEILLHHKKQGPQINDFAKQVVQSRKR